MTPRRLPGIGLALRRVALEPRPSELLWAESIWTPRGRRLRACGRLVPAAGEDAAAFFARLGRSVWLRHAEVAFSIRHPDLQLERLSLPSLGARDANRVAGRRAGELIGGSPEPATGGHLLSDGPGSRAAWLISGPTEFAGFAERRFRKQGLAPAHFSHAHLALGALTRLLAPPSQGELHSFLDIGADHAICVVADGQGWCFSREIPIKFTRLRSDVEDGADPLVRLTTELERTFHYVESELRQGQVGDLILSGTRDDIEELVAELGARLDQRVSLIGDAVEEGPALAMDPALATVVGVALEPSRGGANLLPTPLLRAVRKSRMTRTLTAAALLPALLLVLGGLRLFVGLDQLRNESAALEAEWEDSEPDRELAESFAHARNQAEEARRARRALDRGEAVWGEALQSIGLLLPDEAFTSALRGDRTESGWTATLYLEFRGEDLAAAAEEGSRFATRLGESPIWWVRGVSRETSGGSTGAPVSATHPVPAHFRVDARVAPVVDPSEAGAGERSNG